MASDPESSESSAASRPTRSSSDRPACTLHQYQAAPPGPPSPKHTVHSAELQPHHPQMTPVPSRDTNGRSNTRYSEKPAYPPPGLLQTPPPPTDTSQPDSVHAAEDTKTSHRSDDSPTFVRTYGPHCLINVEIPEKHSAKKKQMVSASAVMPVMGICIPRLVPSAVRRTLSCIVRGAGQIRMMMRRTALLWNIRRSRDRTSGRYRKTDHSHDKNDCRKFCQLHTRYIVPEQYQSIRRSRSLPVRRTSPESSTPHRPEHPQPRLSGTDPDNCRSAQEARHPRTTTQTPRSTPPPSARP